MSWESDPVFTEGICALLVFTAEAQAQSGPLRAATYGVESGPLEAFHLSRQRFF